MTQLKSIYAALTLYSANYDASSQYPELHGLSYVGQGRSKADILKPYGFVREMLYCPSSSIAMKEYLASTYVWPISIAPANPDGSMSRARAHMIAEEHVLGNNLIIVDCHIHDELYYANSERDIDNSVATPFRISLRANGSVRKGRALPPRTTIFTDMTFLQ